MIIKDVIEKIERFAPLSLSVEAIQRGSRDNSGFLVGDKNAQFSSAVVCIDVGKSAIDLAIENGCQLIISHHPFIYYPISNVLTESAKGNNLTRIIQNNLSVYCAHLSMDFTVGGVDDEVAKMLGIKTEKSFELFEKGAYGKLGRVEETDFEEYLARVKKVFQSVRATGENKKIEKVASFCGGGLGFEELAFAKREHADIVVSCDIPHHIVQECVEIGMNVVELSHGESELKAFKKIFEENFKDIKKVYCDIDYRLEDK